MFSDKLLSLLSNFSKYELNRFRKFLQSPYFNEQEILVQLFDLCNQAIRADNLMALDKRKVWQALFPKQKPDDAQLRRLASELNQLALEFYKLEYREQHPVQELLHLQRRLEKPALKKHLASVERSMMQYFESDGTQSAESFLEQFQFYWNVSDRISRLVPTGSFMPNLLTADFHLNSFYAVQKLKLYIAWLVFKRVRVTSESINIIPGFWEYLEEEHLKEIPLIQIYRQVVLCLSDMENEEHFTFLMAQLEVHGNLIQRKDLGECYQIVQNYCTLKINQGKVQYYRSLFQVYKKMMELNMLLEEGQPVEGVYKNVITTSLQIGEFEWAEDFIRNHSKQLPADIRDNAYQYNLANLYFHQKQFDKAIEFLRNVEYSDVTYSMGAKLLLLRTYYETGEFMVLDSLIDSVRIYLRRNKLISKSIVRDYGNFLTFLKKLSSINPANSTEVEKLRLKIVDNPAVISKKWLLQKIDEL